MLIQLSHAHPIQPSEITPEAVYTDRRSFIIKIGLAAAGVALAGYDPSPANAATEFALASLNATKSVSLREART